MSTDNDIFYCGGGLGDMLQFSNFIADNIGSTYIVHSHFKNIKNFLVNFNLQKCYSLEYSSNEERIDQLKFLSSRYEITNTKRDIFFSDKVKKIIFKKQQNNFKNKNLKTVGLHPFGSSFGRDFYKKYGIPSKEIPESVVIDILGNPNFNFLVFGSKNEISSLPIKEKENIKFVSYENIFDSLSCVLKCDLMLASDSCFKTCASMLRIKTICVIADFDDSIRDNFFINPYVSEGVMKIIRNDESEICASRILNFFKQEMLNL